MVIKKYAEFKNYSKKFLILEIQSKSLENLSKLQ